jgi:putative glutamine amidotransferase
MSSQRLIAVSASSAEWSGAERVKLHVNYVRSLEAAGLVPVVVPPLASPTGAAEIIQGAAGLLLTGGEDVDPAAYGAAPHPATGVPHPRRDDTEAALFSSARGRRLPVLAICRGIQLVNVAMGGTLIQDIPTERPSGICHNQTEDRGIRTHRVSVTGGTRLAEALGATTLDVNSYHHQAVNRVAEGLVVTATAPDGIVEGVESADPGWWMVAVQWHPEDLSTDGRPWDKGLFAAFARVIRHAR